MPGEVSADGLGHLYRTYGEPRACISNLYTLMLTATARVKHSAGTAAALEPVAIHHHREWPESK
jgi:hypothetical protein